MKHPSTLHPLTRRHWLAGVAAAGLACGSATARLAHAQAGPVAGGPGEALQRIAFGSCIDPARGQPIWAPILAYRPDLFIFGGDNVYASARPWSLQKLNAAYAQLASQPGFRELRGTVAHLAIWDDHDYGLNDGGAEFVHKAESKAAFAEFWGLPADDPRRQREGLYHARIFGPEGRRVQVILLDIRWFRSPWKPTDQRDAPGRERYLPDDTADRQMLGEVQWQWLARQLREPAQVRLIVSSIQVIVDGHGFEGWHLFPRERARLLRTLHDARASGVVMLSGDRHIGALYRSSTDAPYPVYELTSSGMSHPWRDAKEAGPNRLGPLVTELHFGTIEMDWARATLSLALRGREGTVLQSRTIALDELRIR